VALHCHCTTGVHDRCLMQWLLSGNGREHLEACELCTGTWQGAITGGWGCLLLTLPALCGKASAQLTVSLRLPLPAAAVSIAELVEQAAAFKRAVPGGPDHAELAATLAALHARNTLLAELAELAAQAEEVRQREFAAMKRIAARNHELVAQAIAAEQRWQRRRLKGLPGVLIIAASCFFVGAHCASLSSSATVAQAAAPASGGGGGAA
jgi:hypothetical protein